MFTKKQLKAVGWKGTAPELAVLDLDGLSQRERSRALQAFQRLAPGGSIEVSARRELGRLFHDLRDRFGISFYWWPLERGPMVWRAQIAVPAPHTPLEVTSVMYADYKRLHRLWDEFERAVDLCLVDRLHCQFSDFSLGLRRHIDIEETVLLPMLELQMGWRRDEFGAAAHLEHRSMEAALRQFDQLRLMNDCASILQIFDQPIELMTLFERHYRDEAFLYIVMDRVFSRSEVKKLVAVLQEFEI